MSRSDLIELAARIVGAAETGNWDDVPEGWAIDLAEGLLERRGVPSTTEPAPDGFFRWVVEIEVSPTWVADGFNLDDDSAKRIIEERLEWSRGHETRARVLAAPEPKRVREEQGYKE